MSYYKRITIWENRKRVKLLAEFGRLIVTYFNNVKYSDYGLTVNENEKAKQVRTKINMGLDEAYSVTISTRVNPTVHWSPPPAVGGLARNVDLFGNIFNLCRFEIGPETLLDYIERAIGIYENDRPNALLRTLNPLFWIGLILDYVVSLPFKVVGKMGFDQKRIESSKMGRIIKGILYLIVVLAAFLTVLEKIGYLEKFKEFVSLIRAWIT